MSDDQRRDTVFVAEVEHDGHHIAQRVATFVPNKHVGYTNPHLTTTLQALDEHRVTITVAARSLARYVELAFAGASGRGSVLLVDDYGHHPRELEAVFAAARGGWPERRLVVAFQPHRYSRTRDLLDDFAAVLSVCDAVVLTEVYAAGETPIAGADAKSLARAIRARGRIDPVVVASARDLPDLLPDVLQDGDLLLMMGAGDIGYVASEIAAKGFEGAKKA